MEEGKKKLTLRIFEATENFGLMILEKIHLKGLADFYRKHIEGMRYLICGALATVVNIGAYSLCYYPLHISNSTSNVIAWVVAAVFAYITNRIIVFDSHVNSKKGLAKEITSFFGCRLLTLAVDQAIMIFTVDKLGWNGFLMKVLANIIVIILNFIFSKILIFKKDTKEGKE